MRNLLPQRGQQDPCRHLRCSTRMAAASCGHDSLMNAASSDTNGPHLITPPTSVVSALGSKLAIGCPPFCRHHWTSSSSSPIVT